MRRTPTAVRTAVLLLAGTVLVLSLERIVEKDIIQVVLVATLGPIAGFSAERRAGGTGIIGAVAGGILFPMAAGIFVYLQGNEYDGVRSVDEAGPGLTLIWLGLYGAMIGLAVGVLGWGTLRLTGVSGVRSAARRDRGVVVSDRAGAERRQIGGLVRRSKDVLADGEFRVCLFCVGAGPCVSVQARRVEGAAAVAERTGSPVWFSFARPKVEPWPVPSGR